MPAGRVQIEGFNTDPELDRVAGTAPRLMETMHE